MINSVLVALKLRKTVSERIKFESLSLKNNDLIWQFLTKNKEQIGGKLKHVIDNIENDLSEELEFAGGTITIPASLNCDLNLYNHFKEYFKVDFKIPMFLFHSIGQDETTTYTKVLDDYEVFRKTFTEKNSPQVISYFTFGPALCWGRHSRWRAQFDIFDKGKTTAVTNHACHSWDKTEKVFCNLEGRSEETQLIVVSGQASTDTMADIPICKSAVELKQADRQFRLSNGNAFNFIQTKSGKLSGNHILSARKRKVKLSADQFLELKKFETDRIIYNPYVLPKNNNDIEFGVWWPSQNKNIVLNYIVGKEEKYQSLVLSGGNKIAFRNEFTETNSDLTLWQKYPDHNNEPFDPGQPMLVCRNRKSGDVDFTEFQPCWRNQGFESEIFPHWLGNFKALKPSSRLTGIVNFNLFEKGQLILQALRPKGCENISGKLEINVFDRNGKQIQVIEKRAENSKCFNFDFSKNKYGPDIAALRVRSTDVDFTANLLQWNKNGATSLQHLWGY